MNDFELMGFPYALVVGKGLEKDELEFIDRKTLEKKSYQVKKYLILLKECRMNYKLSLSPLFY